MTQKLRQFISITHLAILETWRQPVFLLTYTFGLVLIPSFPVFISFTLGEGAKLTRDSALALHFVLGLVLGGFSACATLTHEIRRGTAAAVLTKPVSREVFFLAKYTGIALCMLAFSATLTLATLMAVRTATPYYDFDWWGSGPLLVAVVLSYAWAGALNYFKRTPFVSAATMALMLSCVLAFAISWANPPAERAAFDTRIVAASVLIALGILVLASISVTLAIRMDVVPTLSLTSFLFVTGLVSDYFFGRNAARSLMARVLHTVLPNWQHFWMADALSGSGSIPWIYVAQTTVYAAAYLAGVLCLGLFAFRNLEVRM